MMNLEFKTKEELYKRVYPALSVKKTELKRKGYDYIEERDIWDYLSQYVFSKKYGLTLADIVSEIMHINEESLNQYIIDKKIKE